MKWFVAFLIVAGIILLLLLNLHVVKTKTGVVFTRKLSMSFKDTYVDMSLWESSDLEDHQGLVRALEAAGHEDLVEAIDERPSKEERMVSPWAAPAASPEAVETATRTQTGSGSTQKRIRDKIKKEVSK